MRDLGEELKVSRLFVASHWRSWWFFFTDFSREVACLIFNKKGFQIDDPCRPFDIMQWCDFGWSQFESNCTLYKPPEGFTINKNIHNLIKKNGCKNASLQLFYFEKPHVRASRKLAEKLWRSFLSQNVAEYMVWYMGLER